MENRIVLPPRISVTFYYMPVEAFGSVVPRIWKFFSAAGGDNKEEDAVIKEATTVSDNDGILEPKAKKELEKLKLKVADETLGRDMETRITAGNYEEALDKRKWEAAEELGLKNKIEDVGWENMTTGDVGRIGGKVGGQIGGQMGKELIAMAESQMAPVVDEAMVKEAVEASMRGG